MTRTAQCPDCGGPLAAGSPGGFCPACLLRLGNTEVSDAGNRPADTRGSASVPEVTGTVIGRYKLLESIGEGGFGMVWMAEQTEPVRRKVALKIIKLGMDTQQVVARFEAERQALALMEHPHIARVFDGGATATGRPYFVMELVRGIPITSYCDTAKLTTQERIELFIEVCQAVQHAHQKGVIHRDLKPSNILVTEQNGRPVPKVIDFGIAKATGPELTEKTLFTQFNQLMGTPAYMSPEQAGLGSLDLDTRTDIYSLGVVLYELLTGRTPLDARQFFRAGQEAMLKAIRELDPPRPSTHFSTLALEDLASLAGRRREQPQRLHRLVRGDLDWIVLKSIEKDRSRRYESANGLASDLQRFLRNEAVTAVPPTLAYQFNKFARRHRTALATAAVFLAVLLAAVVVSTWQAVRATRLAASEKEASKRAQEAARETRLHLAQARFNAYASEINVAQQAIAENNLERALQLLDKQRPKSGEDDLRGFEWRHLWQLCQGNELAILRASIPAFRECAVGFSPDGKFFAYAGDNKVSIVDAKTLKPSASLPTDAHTVAFSPDSRLLVTSTVQWGGKVKLWAMASWSEVSAPALAQANGPAFFSPDGRWLVTGTQNEKHLQLRSTETWQVVASCPQTPVLPVSHRSAVVFSPDGKLLLTPWLDMARLEGGVRLWKVPTLESYANLFPAGEGLQSAAFLEGGKRLATGSWQAGLLIWDLESTPPRLIQEERQHTAYIPAIATAPGAATFATASADQSIGIWDATTRKRIARWRGHTRETWAAAMSPDGRLVASSSPDGSIRLWHAQPPKNSEWLHDSGTIAGFTADGRTLVLGPRAGDYRWQRVTGTNRVVIPIPSDPPLEFEFDTRPFAVFGNEPLAALGRSRGQVELWNLGTRERVAVWNAGTNQITAVAFTPDGKAMVTGDSWGVVKIWDSNTRELIAGLPANNEGAVRALAFSKDGQWLAAGSFHSLATRVWSFANQKLALTLATAANEIAFAPDGKSLATCSVGGNAAQIWEFPSGKHHAALKGHVGGVTLVTFSPDGRTLATGSYDGRIKLWNIPTSQEVATLPHAGTLESLRFSPDGRMLAASYWMFPGLRTELFRAPTFQEIAAAEAGR